MPKESYIVTLTRPWDVSISEMQRFIHDSLGSNHPVWAHTPLDGGISCAVRRVTSTKEED